MDDTDVEGTFLVQKCHRTREYGIKAPLGFIAPKDPIDAAVVALRQPIKTGLDGQLFPLTTESQQFQNLVENLVQRELRLRTATPLGQMRQDKLLKLF